MKYNFYQLQLGTILQTANQFMQYCIRRDDVSIAGITECRFFCRPPGHIFRSSSLLRFKTARFWQWQIIWTIPCAPCYVYLSGEVQGFSIGSELLSLFWWFFPTACNEFIVSLISNSITLNLLLNRCYLSVVPSTKYCKKRSS